MLRVNGAAFYELVRHLTDLGGEHRIHVLLPGEGWTDPLKEEVRTATINKLAWIREGLKALEAPMTDKEAERMENAVRDGIATYKSIIGQYEDLCSRLRDELDFVHLFVFKSGNDYFSGRRRSCG